MWLDRYRGLLCDLDGCLLSGDTVLPGARDFIAYAGERLWIISNNSTDTPSVLAKKLMDLGLPVPAQHIVLAGTTAIQYVARTTPGARIMIYAFDDIIAYARSLGLFSDEEHPEVVLLARGRSILLCAAESDRAATRRRRRADRFERRRNASRTGRLPGCRDGRSARSAQNLPAGSEVPRCRQAFRIDLSSGVIARTT